MMKVFPIIEIITLILQFLKIKKRVFLWIRKRFRTFATFRGMRGSTESSSFCFILTVYDRQERRKEFSE